jgi:hypothetical protein
MNNYIDEFINLYNIAPDVIKKEIDKTKNINQSSFWHEEGVVYNHIQLVTNRLYNKYKFIDLTLSGFLHDLGKIYTTEFNSEKNTYNSNGHEDKSCEMILQDDFRYWIKQMKGDFDIIFFIIQNHMRIKHLSDMKTSKQKTLIQHPWFSLLLKFNSADFGGNELFCKSLSLNKLLNTPYNEKNF